MTYDQIVQGLRDATYELQNEGRLVRAGLKAEQDTAAIVERFAWLFDLEALRTVEAAGAGEAGARVRAALIQGLIDRRTAALQDRLTTFYANAQARAGGETVPFYTALAAISREPDPARREALGEAVGAVMEQADGLALELEAAGLDLVHELGHSSHTAFWAELKGVDYAPLAAELERVAEAASGLYRSWVEPRMEAAGHAYGDCPQAHLSFFRGLAEHDALFTKEAFEPAMRRTFSALGLELFSSPAIHLDLEDRPAKNPRASVWVPEAGREVHLLVRPTGGNADYMAFLHESGHALHFGLTDPAAGWPLANVGRSMAYAELWSFLVEGIGREPAWIAAATGVEGARARAVAGDLTGVHLMLFMRYAGKLASELALYAGDPLDAERGRSLFGSLPGRRTGFVYDPRAWQFDRDPGYYSADYLRAWLAQAELERLLSERFGEEWWARQEAGAWLRAQWRRGSLPEAEELIGEMGGRPWSGEALLAGLERGLRPAA